MVKRIASGRPAAHVAAEMRVSRTTAYRWWHCYQDEGLDGLFDRSLRLIPVPTERQQIWKLEWSSCVRWKNWDRLVLECCWDTGLDHMTRSAVRC